MINVLGLSGGKDSVATWLYMLRTGMKPVPVYDDTLWEWKGHAAYLNELERLIGTIRARTQPPYGFAGGVRKHGMFPKRTARWCTDELKIQPFREELDRIRDETGDDVTVFVGVRREESEARALLPEREWADHYDCWLVRPILDWKLAQVVEEHHRANVPLHPLYFLGAERVGCFPCIGEQKAGIALVARIQPERIDEIEVLERESGGTMFVLEETAAARRARGAPDEERKVFPTPIREVVAWASTARGGKQLQLVPQPTGCARWGICDPAKKDTSHGG